MSEAMSVDLANKNIIINELTEEKRNLKIGAPARLPRPIATKSTPAKPEVAAMIKDIQENMEKRFLQLENTIQTSIANTLGAQLGELPTPTYTATVAADC